MGLAVSLSLIMLINLKINAELKAYHVCSSQLGPPILNIFSLVPVAQPVAPNQWGGAGGGEVVRGGEG
jgi:hypothetical protein